MTGLWRRLPLSAKIVLPYFLLTLLVGVGGTFVATRLAAQSVNDRLTTALVEALRSAEAQLLEREGQRVEALDALLDREGLARALAERDGARLLALLEPLPPGADWAGLVDAQGRTVAARRAAGPSAGDGASPVVAASRPVELTLQGVRDFGGERQGGFGDLGGEPALVAVAPVRRGEQVVGALVVGTDVATAARDLKRTTLTDTALFDAAGRPLVNTLAPDRPRRDLPGIDTTPSEDELRPAVMRVGERDYLALVAPLRVRGVTAGALATALPSDAVDRIGSDTRLWLTGLFGGAMVLSVMLGLAISRVIGRPVNALAAAARAVGAGDLTRRSRVDGSDEIGVLGRTFDAMAANLQLRQTQLSEAYLNTVRALAAAVDAKDPYTHGHSQRVAAYALRVARHLGVDEGLMPLVEMGGLLHDVGKIGVPDHVLLKPGKLDDTEFALIKRHTLIGHEILRPVGFDSTVTDIVRHHHERMNGRGYPDGLQGESIPLVARIVCVCDAYDTMTSERSYQRSRGHDGALAELRRWAGEQFDPRCVEALAAAVVAPIPPGVAQRSYSELAGPGAVA